MTLITYVVYDLDSGAAVHVHAEPAGLDSSLEEIIQLADPRRSRRLGVVRAPRDGLPAGAVCVVDGELRTAEGEVGYGAAGGDDALGEPVPERRYEFRPPPAHPG